MLPQSPTTTAVPWVSDGVAHVVTVGRACANKGVLYPAARGYAALHAVVTVRSCRLRPCFVHGSSEVAALP